MIDMWVKFFVPEGHYQRFMAWMANAMFGKCNYTILCWYGDTTDAILTFLQRTLPCIVIDDRVRCLKKYNSKNVIFTETVPRTQRQRQKLFALSRTRNIIFVNPSRTAANHRIHGVYEILDGIHPALLQNTAEFVCLVRKFYMATHATCLQLSHFIEQDELMGSGLSMAVYKRFLEYRETTWPFLISVGFPEFLANMTLLAPEGRVDGKRIRVPSTYARPGPTSWMSWFSRSYMNSTGFLLWLVRVHSGLVLPSTIMFVDDSTTTTIQWMRHAVKHLMVGYVSCTEDSFLLVDYASYDLIIFDCFIPPIDLALVASRTNVLVIGTYMPVQTQIVRAEFVGSSINYSIPHEYFDEAYDVLVKEPTFVVFVRKCIKDGTYKFGEPMVIRNILEQCHAWCDENRIPWKITASIALQVQEITAAIALRCYFRCACVGSAVVFWGNKRYGI